MLLSIPIRVDMISLGGCGPELCLCMLRTVMVNL
jgi:hypothetical protein